MTINDEPVYEDALGHYEKAKRVGHRLLKCKPPYTVGVCGSWGAGKTSFLKKLWAYLGGDIEWENGKYGSLSSAQHEEWFKESNDDFNKLLDKRKLELIWFNPWQHQFESSPLVALLHEIRQHFSLTRKFINKAGKLTDVSAHATLNMLAEFGKGIVPIPSAKGIMERGREYEAENYLTPLTSQKFRDFFESAITAVTSKNGLLVVFIDDLDRCEGDVAYRLLESLKLYLNASNAVYVLGIDQRHLENSIAKALSGEKDVWRYRPLARDYLSKIFQNHFVLPVPRHATTYVEQVLDVADTDFQTRLKDLFDFKVENWIQLVTALDENLPHNPRKIKSFITSWKLYLDSLDVTAGQKLDWRLTLILHYLAQFEEPLFRKVEESPAFYSDHIVKFCKEGSNTNRLFDGLERPYEMSKTQLASDETGGFGTPSTLAKTDDKQKADSIAHPEPRIFWISRLIMQLANDTTFSIGDEIIHGHLVRTGGKL